MIELAGGVALHAPLAPCSCRFRPSGVLADWVACRHDCCCLTVREEHIAVALGPGELALPP